jgi:hypothetical protein
MLYTATHREKMESAIILLEAGCPLSILCWENIAPTTNEDVVNAFIRQTKSGNNGDSKAPIVDTLAKYTNELYHAFDLSVRNAELLFEAGFDDVTITTELGTPLWRHASSLVSQYHKVNNLERLNVILWLVQNGASL